MSSIREATSDADWKAIRRLFEEYAASLGFSLCFQGFDRELAGLPGCYARPIGVALLAETTGADGEQAQVGCAALRPFDDGVCEMKRLYVQPAHRGLRLGRRMVERLISEARSIGYCYMRLDTLERMVEANALYRSCGFYEIPPYSHHPVEGSRCFELKLDGL